MNMKRFIAIIIAMMMLLSLVACGKDEKKPKETEAEKTEAATKGEDETPEKSDDEDDDEVEEEPEFINPLTGLEVDRDISMLRPVSIMVNNINVSLPQSGISDADIIYECLAEGGITRLMMISNDWENLSKIGSCRSARDYYIDYAESYNCIFIHAGGSTYAYDTIAARGTNNIDGVRGPGGAMFYRDQDRINSGYGYEHTLFIYDGAAIKSTIESVGYSTTKAEGYEEPVNLMPWGETATLDNAAKHIKVVMSNYQVVDYVFDEDEGKYLRWQYSGMPHMDDGAGEQLAFENVVLMFNDSGAIAGDDKNRIWMQTTGTGTGYYITDGTYEEITWQKDAHDSPIKFFYLDGTEVEFNRGKTMINVVNNAYKTYTVFDDDTYLLDALEDAE